MKVHSIVALAVMRLFCAVSPLWAHCEVPCGIYGDEARFSAIAEDVMTIEKAMGKIAELATKMDGQSANQLSRWVSTKEEHANKIQQVVAQYFMTQRLKAPAADDKNVTERNGLHESVVDRRYGHRCGVHESTIRQAVVAPVCCAVRKKIALSERDRKRQLVHDRA